MSSKRDMTASKRNHDLYVKYKQDEVEKTAANIAYQKRKEEEWKRKYKNEGYKKMITKWHTNGMPVNNIYIRLRPLILKDLKFDPKAMIEMVTGEKITVVTKKVTKDNEHNDR